MSKPPQMSPYDQMASDLVDKFHARTVCIIIAEGDDGNGVSLSGDPSAFPQMANSMRLVADRLDNDVRAFLAKLDRKN